MMSGPLLFCLEFVLFLFPVYLRASPAVKGFCVVLYAVFCRPSCLPLHYCLSFSHTYRIIDLYIRYSFVSRNWRCRKSVLFKGQEVVRGLA